MTKPVGPSGSTPPSIPPGIRSPLTSIPTPTETPSMLSDTPQVTELSMRLLFLEKQPQDPYVLALETLIALKNHQNEIKRVKEMGKALLQEFPEFNQQTLQTLFQHKIEKLVPSLTGKTQKDTQARFKNFTADVKQDFLLHPDYARFQLALFQAEEIYSRTGSADLAHDHLIHELLPPHNNATIRRAISNSFARLKSGEATYAQIVEDLKKVIADLPYMDHSKPNLEKVEMIFTEFKHHLSPKAHEDQDAFLLKLQATFLQVIPTKSNGDRKTIQKVFSPKKFRSLFFVIKLKAAFESLPANLKMQLSEKGFSSEWLLGSWHDFHASGLPTISASSLHPSLLETIRERMNVLKNMTQSTEDEILKFEADFHREFSLLFKNLNVETLYNKSVKEFHDKSARDKSLKPEALANLLYTRWEHFLAALEPIVIKIEENPESVMIAERIKDALGDV